MSADTIVPDYANPQSLNRYSYVINNPLRYTDPTGHMMSTDDGGGCAPCNQLPQPDPNPDPEPGGDNSCSMHPEACGLETIGELVGGCGVGETCISAWHQPDYWDLNPSHRDYYTLTVSYWYGTGSIIVDRYGQAYYALGVTVSIPELSGAGALSLTGGRIEQSPGRIPYQLNLPNFLTGLTINATAGYGPAGGITFSPGTLEFGGTGWNLDNPDVWPVAFEIGASTPSYGISATYGDQIESERVLNIAQSIIRTIRTISP